MHTIGSAGCVRLAVFCALGQEHRQRQAMRFLESQRRVSAFWAAAWGRVIASVSPPPLVALLIDSVVYPPVRYFLHAFFESLRWSCDLRVVEAAIRASVRTPLCVTSDAMHDEVVRCLCAGRIEPTIGNVSEGPCALHYSCCGLSLSFIDHVLLAVLLAFSAGDGPIPANAQLLRDSVQDACRDPGYCMRFVFNRWRLARSAQ